MATGLTRLTLCEHGTRGYADLQSNALSRSVSVKVIWEVEQLTMYQISAVGLAARRCRMNLSHIRDTILIKRRGGRFRHRRVRGSEPVTAWMRGRRWDGPR